MFLKPKDQPKPKSTGPRVKKSGAEVCTTEAQWRKRRWELYVLAEGTCFMCGCTLAFANVDGFASGGSENYHAHHRFGGRGIGGGKRDDRIFIPGEWTDEDRERYPFAKEPEAGMTYNLLPECNNCHMSDEHNQGCQGELQWSHVKAAAESDHRPDRISEAIAEIDEFCDC